MIKRIIGKIMASTAGKKNKLGKAVEIPLSKHRIDTKLVEDKAKEVVSTLKSAGFQAYIVGGAVRDLLLGLKPKDFDIATNATPEEVKRLFRRAFIIGRRFRIVHVVFGRGREHEVIEVSTFRALLDNALAEQVQGNEKTSKADLAGMRHAVDQHGRVLRDNVWGSQQEDAARRDFTINAMYYDPERQVVVDYHKGFEDCQKHVIRLIGDPLSRYREDPVRILRAVRFAAKLETLKFNIEAKTVKPIQECKILLAQIPQSRMFDEVLKLLQTGHATSSLRQLEKLGMSRGIYPLLDLITERSQDPLVQAALNDTDRRINEGKSAAPYFLLACVLWDEVRNHWQSKVAAGEHVTPALGMAIDEVFERRIGDVSGRGKLAADMREVWMLQPRFERRSISSAPKLIENLRFRAGYDFLRLRAVVGEVDVTLADWWHEYSLGDEDQREGMLREIAKQQVKGVKGKKPVVKRVVRLAASRSADGEQADQAHQSAEASDDASGPSLAAKKRRRRKRKPGSDSSNTPPEQAA